MKKTAAIILAAAMAMGLTACSGFTDEKPEATTTAGTAETTTGGTQTEAGGKG
ncbi:MAG TPA: LacI family transcriptional regulator, partial [Lachnoclostridium sp.]|nr:LacI family transcriptional regulator [Lachnoclostridium sp.]